MEEVEMQVQEERKGDGGGRGGRYRRRWRDEEERRGGERRRREEDERGGGGPSAGTFSEPRSALMALRHENWTLIYPLPPLTGGVAGE